MVVPPGRRLSWRRRGGEEHERRGSRAGARGVRGSAGLGGGGSGGPGTASRDRARPRPPPPPRSHDSLVQVIPARPGSAQARSRERGAARRGAGRGAQVRGPGLRPGGGPRRGETLASLSPRSRSGSRCGSVPTPSYRTSTSPHGRGGENKRVRLWCRAVNAITEQRSFGSLTSGNALLLLCGVSSRSPAPGSSVRLAEPLTTFPGNVFS